MDYEKLSDFKINKMVTMKLGGFNESEYSSISGNFHKGKPEDEGYRIGIVVDYCDNPADAWPIILDNSICIEKRGDKTEFWRAITWNQISGNEYMPIYQNSDKNPLRAAMIVFLMMNEGGE